MSSQLQVFTPSDFPRQGPDGAVTPSRAYDHIQRITASQLGLRQHTIGSIKSPMPSELKGMLARFPTVAFCMQLCGLRMISGHIE